MNSISRIQRLPNYTAILTTILVVPQLMDPINIPKLWILSVGAGFSLILFSTQLRDFWDSGKKSVLFIAGVFLLSLILSTLVSRQDLYRSLVGTWGRNNGTLSYLCLLFIMLGLVSVNSNETSKLLISSLAILGILGAGYGWMQNNGIDPISWENPNNKFILTLGNSDFASAFLALTAISTLTYILKSGTKSWLRMLLIGSYIVQIYLVKESDAIQGLLILVFGSAILVGLWLKYSERNKFKEIVVIWWGLLVIVTFTAVAGLAGTGPFATLLHSSLTSLQDRYYHWIAAAKMLKDHLLFGVGIDSFGDYYRRYRIQEAIDLRGTVNSGTNNAHNIVMQIAATGGLVLLFPYLLIIGFTTYRAIFAFKYTQDKILVSGVFSIWIAYQIQSLVSIDQIGLTVWGWTSTGCLIALSYRDREVKLEKPVSRDFIKSNNKQVNVKKSILSIFVLIGFLPSVFLAPTLWNELNLREQVINLVDPNSQVNLQANAEKVFKLAMSSNQPELRFQSVKYLVQGKSVNKALELAIRTTQEFPESLDSWDATARIYEALGQYQNALIARKMTIKLDPLNEEFRKLLLNDLAST